MATEWATMSLDDLMEEGRSQTGNLTFYKLVFQALEQFAHQNSPTPEIYRSSFNALTAGFVASVAPEFRPQAIAAKNLLARGRSF